MMFLVVSFEQFATDDRFQSRIPVLEVGESNFGALQKFLTTLVEIFTNIFYKKYLNNLSQ